MTDWTSLLKAKPGVYRLPPRTRAASVERAVEPAGWRVFTLDGEKVANKTSFLKAAAKALHFPSYFGMNWDAFEECIRDLEWAPARGYVILFPHVERFARSEDWPTAEAIFQSAVAYWQGQGVPMVVLVGGVVSLPQLPQ